MAAAKIPSTATITNHGLLIQVAPGTAVGAITSWGPRQNRTATPVFEFGSLTTGGGDDIPADFGEPYEIVPGNVGGTEISVRRYDVYTKRMENAFTQGTIQQNLMMLTRQDQSIRLIEFWKSPDGSLDFTYIYYGCWFTNIGREHAADGNRIVMANATIMFSRRREV